MFTVILRLASGLRSSWCVVALVAFSLVTLAQGCGSGSPPTSSPTGSGHIKLNPEEDYKYEGEGTAKRKVELTQRERQAIRRQRAKEASAK